MEKAKARHSFIGVAYFFIYTNIMESLGSYAEVNDGQVMLYHHLYFELAAKPTFNNIIQRLQCDVLTVILNF